MQVHCLPFAFDVESPIAICGHHKRQDIGTRYEMKLMYSTYFKDLYNLIFEHFLCAKLHVRFDTRPSQI